MSRDLTASYLSAMQADVVNLALFFEGEFNSGTLRLWTGAKDITWNSQTWSAVGTFLGISVMTETSDIVANGVTVTLSGVDPANITLAISEARQGLKGRVWVAVMTDPETVIADPFQSFVGLLDVPEIKDEGESTTISITYESRLVDLQRPREFRYTHESQKILYPDDLGFEYVASIQEQEITWGRQ